MQHKADEEIWSKDLLGRRADGEFIIEFLLGRLNDRQRAGRPKSYVLNINASWGLGKTFFLSCLARQLELDGYLVASVNAWTDDHADDPLLAVIAAIDKAIRPIVQKQALKNVWKDVRKKGTKIAIAAAKGAVAQAARKVIGEGVDAILQELNSEEDSTKITDDVVSQIKEAIAQRETDALADFQQNQRMILDFRRQLAEFLSNVSEEKTKTPLFVLVDELDRCRPSYAIALLERMKHLFDIDNVVFVVATDTTQLAHTVGAIYGSTFDARGYLKRFFDREYFFTEPTIGAFVETILRTGGLDAAKVSVPPDKSIVQFLSEVFSYFGLSLRDIEQCLDIFRSIVTVWPLPVPLEAIVLVPLIIAHQNGLDELTNSELPARLQKVAQSNGKRKRQWIVMTEQRNEISGIDLFTRVMEYAEKPLVDVFHTDPRGRVDTWVIDRFRAEMIGINNKATVGKARPKSVILSYRSLISSAGRLMPNTQ